MPDCKKSASINGRGSMVITGWKLIRRQFLALFIKRFHHARRSRKGLIAQVMASVCHIDELKGYTGTVAWEGSKQDCVKYTHWLPKSVSDIYDRVRSFKLRREYIHLSVVNSWWGLSCLKRNPWWKQNIKHWRMKSSFWNDVTSGSCICNNHLHFLGHVSYKKTLGRQKQAVLRLSNGAEIFQHYICPLKLQHIWLAMKAADRWWKVLHNFHLTTKKKTLTLVICLSLILPCTNNVFWLGTYQQLRRWHSSISSLGVCLHYFVLYKHNFKSQN